MALLGFAHARRFRGGVVPLVVAERGRRAPGDLQLHWPLLKWAIVQPYTHKNYVFASGHAAQLQRRAAVGEDGEIYLCDAVGGSH